MPHNKRAKMQIAALQIPMKPGWPTKPEPGQKDKKREGFKPVPMPVRPGKKPV